MIRCSTTAMNAPLWSRTAAGLGQGARTFLSYPSVPLASSPFGSKIIVPSFGPSLTRLSLGRIESRSEPVFASTAARSFDRWLR